MARESVKTGNWGSASKRIALIGDSTLDNILWVGDNPCISEQLAEQVQDSAVANLAADGFTSVDTLHGSTRVISVGMRGKLGEGTGVDPLQFEADGRFCPLVRLAGLDPPPTHVVLSVGGNDVREILRDMRRLPEVIQHFAPNYIAILDACRRVTLNVIVMLQYRPSFFMDERGYGVYQAMERIPGPGDSVQKINQLMQTIYAPVFAVARERRLAVVDLPRTFDIFCDDLYSHQIEPSARGGEVIISILSHVVEQHSLEKTSTFYTYAPCIPGAGEVREEANTGEPWVIPYDPDAVLRRRSTGDVGSAPTLHALVAMGFEREKANAALARHGGDQERVVADLLED